MTRTDRIRAETGEPGSPLVGRALATIHWGWAFAVVFLAAVLQANGHLNGDDSWFLTFAEKYLDGLTPYVDVADPNPPASFLVYAPAVQIGRLLGLAPEIVVAVLTFLAAVLAIAVTMRVAQRAGFLDHAEARVAVPLALYLSLVVPAFCFAEREHIAFILLLPVAAVLAARADDRSVAPMAGLVAGFGAGLAATFKPYFVLPLVLAFLCAVWSKPRCAWRMAPELAAIMSVLAAYAAAVLLAFPAYASMFWLALDIYAPVRDTVLHLLGSPLVLANGALLVAYLYAARCGATDPQARVCATLSLGFLATFLIQGKGWNNHAFPGIGFGLLALAWQIRELARAGSAPLSARGGAAVAKLIFVPLLFAAPFFFGAATLLTNGEEHPGLKAAVAGIAPPRPKIAALAEQLDYGHPLVRQLGGAWIGRQNCLWISWGVKYLRGSERDPAAIMRRQAYLEADLRTFAQDIETGEPDILIVESPQLEAWAHEQPALASLFTDFVRAASIGDIQIWRRRTP